MCYGLKTAEKDVICNSEMQHLFYILLLIKIPDEDVKVVQCRISDVSFTQKCNALKTKPLMSKIM